MMYRYVCKLYNFLFRPAYGLDLIWLQTGIIVLFFNCKNIASKKVLVYVKLLEAFTCSLLIFNRFLFAFPSVELPVFQICFTHIKITLLFEKDFFLVLHQTLKKK